MIITYPPEMLPSPAEGEDADIFIIGHDGKPTLIYSTVDGLTDRLKLVSAILLNDGRTSAADDVEEAIIVLRNLAALQKPQDKAAPLHDRIAELEAALADMTTNRIHDALCQCFEEWENEHAAFERAKAALAAQLKLVEAQQDKLVATEREACARIADEANWDGDTTPLELSNNIAAAIRARGESVSK